MMAVPLSAVAGRLEALAALAWAQARKAGAA